jgi:hypothetical protein
MWIKKFSQKLSTVPYHIPSPTSVLHLHLPSWLQASMGAEWSQVLNSGHDASIEEGGTATIKGTFGCCAVRARETPSKLRSRLPDWSGVSPLCCFRYCCYVLCACFCLYLCACVGVSAPVDKARASQGVSLLDWMMCVCFSLHFCLDCSFIFVCLCLCLCPCLCVDILRSNNSGLDISPVPEGFLYIGAIGGAADITPTAASNLTTSCYKPSCYKPCCCSSSYSS